jgi:hypothetical protein
LPIRLLVELSWLSLALLCFVLVPQHVGKTPFLSTGTKNAHPVPLKNSARSRPQGRNADFSLMWVGSGLPTDRELAHLLAAGGFISTDPPSVKTGILFAANVEVRQLSSPECREFCTLT